MKTITEKDVAILIPLSSREELTPSEKVSLRQLNAYLDKYDTYFLAPEKLKLEWVDQTRYKISWFADKFFGSVRAHNRLMTDPATYQRFSAYKYILVYHLDALVFSDQLLEWCNKGFDYIAPPWMFLDRLDMQWLDKPRVGNGGFSLRKVESFIKLYQPGKRWMEPKEMARFVSQKKMKSFRNPFYHLAKHLFKLRKFNNVRTHLVLFLDRHNKGEDTFISFYGSHYVPGFKIASVEAALEFAFETEPKRCFELNKKQMPFGCHAYERYDLEFWEPYIVKP